MTDYLRLSEVLAIHQRQIQLYGGSEGVRDINALHSALGRLQTGYYDDIIQEACALMESIAVNHPFIDGNKRVAFATTDVFLRINGYRIYAKPMTLYAEMIRLFETQSFNLSNIERFLRPIVKPVAI